MTSLWWAQTQERKILSQFRHLEQPSYFGYHFVSELTNCLKPFNCVGVVHSGASAQSCVHLMWLFIGRHSLSFSGWKGQTVGGLTVYCVDAFTTWNHTANWQISFKTSVVDIDWSDSRRVDCIPSRCIHHMISYCRMT